MTVLANSYIAEFTDVKLDLTTGTYKFKVITNRGALFPSGDQYLYEEHVDDEAKAKLRLKIATLYAPIHSMRGVKILNHASLYAAGCPDGFFHQPDSFESYKTKCECGSDKLNLGGHSSWCPKGSK